MIGEEVEKRNSTHGSKFLMNKRNNTSQIKNFNILIQLVKKKRSEMFFFFGHLLF